MSCCLQHAVKLVKKFDVPFIDPTALNIMLLKGVDMKYESN